ncbi:glycosyltransferase [Horticoccus luteus]|uniref:Glycosyltransferase n=1 Tax=Horticoccus luteus TaxID=2862869 RepID=A0A8F9TQV8_9BACT|nr:glycosyltransferase [Horticoccus luteus]QYM77519.1 glycosyltransferase [Horticoccus luteus]
MIKLLKASSYYPRYLAWFYARNPHLREASYAEQHAALMADSFALSDSWSRHLGGAQAQFAVTELVVNAEPLQKRWAQENGVEYRETHWLADIFLAQFRAVAPRVFYAHAQEINPTLRRACRGLAGGPLYVISYDGIGRHTPEVFTETDMVITCLRSSADFYRAQGVESHWMMFGFDPSVLTRIRRDVTPSGVSFVGGLQVRIGHQERARTLAYIAEAFPLERWVSGLPTDAEALRLWGSFARRRDWRGFWDFPSAAIAARRLRAGNRGEVFGMEMFSRLAASRITLNVHIAAAGNQAANIRLFEATGAGACLLTDWKENIGELFEPDREVVVFRHPEEAVEKIHYLLEHDSERAEIARKGQRRTLENHNYATRLRELAAVLEARL